MIIGILDGADARGGLADRWARTGPALHVVLASPPVDPLEVGSTAECVIFMSAATAFETVRAGVGPGPTLFRAVVTPGTEPGEGAVAIVPEAGAAGDTIARVKEALSWVGSVEVVTEDVLDAAAAVVLGGTDFLSRALDGLVDGAVRDGMSRAEAGTFARHTLLATALLVRGAGSPADLKDQVASPGGTTIAALASLEDAAVRGAFIRAIEATAQESRAERHAWQGLVR